MENQVSEKKIISDLDSVKALTDSEIRCCYLAIRDAQNVILSAQVFPSLEEDGTAVLTTYEDLSQTQLEQRLLYWSVRKFKTLMAKHLLFTKGLAGVSFELAEMPSKLRMLPCGAYEWELPTWMECVCERALQVNPHCNSGDSVFGWNYKGVMVVNYFDGTFFGRKVPEPFSSRIWFDPAQKLRTVSSSEYWKLVSQKFSSLECSLIKCLLRCCSLR